MRILLVNDTSATTNPGCQAAVEGIQLAYSERYGACEWRSLPLGYWAEHFGHLAATPRDCVERQAGKFPRHLPSAKAVDLKSWLLVLARAWANDSALREHCRWCDLMVVNGEGSIHHNLPRALALLALLRAAQEMGLAAHLVNCTLYALDSQLTRAALSGLPLLHVRDQASEQWLRDLGLASLCTSDLACLSFAKLLEENAGCLTPIQAQTQAVAGAAVGKAPGVLPKTGLISAGVGAYADYLAQLLETASSLPIQWTYFSIGDGGERALAQKLCSQSGLSCLAAESLSRAALALLVQSQACAVSGRHHMNLLFFLAGIPIVPLPSNTNKIEESLRALGYPLSPARDTSELELNLRRVLDEPAPYVAAATVAGARALASARSFAGLLP